MSLETDSKTVPGPYQTEPRLERDEQGVWHVHGYSEARELLKEQLIQEGFNAEDIRHAGFSGVLYSHGEPHRQLRAAIAKFFSPTTVQQKHMLLIEQTADEIIADLKKEKRAEMRELSQRMASVVAATVIGLNPTPGMIRRMEDMLHAPKFSDQPLVRRLQMSQANDRRIGFMLEDVHPAVAQRRKAPQEDVISHMLSKDKSLVEIMVESVVYGSAGMATTQEFICIVLLHCLQKPELREIMLSNNQTARYEALNEILRLEPIIGKLYRRTEASVTVTSAGQEYTIPAGDKIAFHVYDVNVDEKAVPNDSTHLEVHRTLERGVYRSLIGFGSGSHRCPGEHLALAETDVFIQKLLQVPGQRIESGPNIVRNETVEGYEVNDLILAVD